MAVLLHRESNQNRLIHPVGAPNTRMWCVLLSFVFQHAALASAFHSQAFAESLLALTQPVLVQLLPAKTATQLSNKVAFVHVDALMLAPAPHHLAPDTGCVPTGRQQSGARLSTKVLEVDPKCALS